MSATAMIQDLPNVGVLVDQLNPFLFQRIKKEVEGFRQDFNSKGKDPAEAKDMLRFFHKKKAGYSIDYTFSPALAEDINKEVLKLVNFYESKYNYFNKMFNFTTDTTGCDMNMDLERLWLNFQRAGEFMPLHNHTGIYSFVIWAYIPYNIKDEQENLANIDLIKNRSAQFEFIYPDVLGKQSIFSLPVDKAWEGRICIFPADLHHQVHPFYTSDDVRISVAGNYRVKLIKDADAVC
jgi:hypothetical protein